MHPCFKIIETLTYDNTLVIIIIIYLFFAILLLDVEKKPVSIVFCTPEALQTSAVRKLLMSKTFNKRLSLLACDEAHCISEW